MSGGAPNEAAMSLWQKFSDLQSQAEAHRNRRAAADERAVVLQGEIERLRKEQERDQEDIGFMDAETEKYRVLLDCSKEDEKQSNAPREDRTDPSNITIPLLGEIANHSVSIQDQISRIDDKCQDATARLRCAERSLEQWSQWKQDQSTSAIENSRIWTEEVQQLRFQALSVGLPHAFLGAAFTSKGLEDPTQADKMVSSDINLQDEGDVENDDDPLSWIVPESDFNLVQAVEGYKKQHKKYMSANEAVITVKQKLQSQQSKYELKKQRASVLHDQLRKVRTECLGFESQLEQLQRKAKSSNHSEQPTENHNGHVFDNNQDPVRQTDQHPSVTQRNSSAAVCPPIRNPYANHTAKHSSQPPPRVSPPSISVHPSSSRYNHDELMDICIGRRRRDRQFGCSVGIGGTSEVVTTAPASMFDASDDDEDDDQGVFSNMIGLQKRHKKS